MRSSHLPSCRRNTQARSLRTTMVAEGIEVLSRSHFACRLAVQPPRYRSLLAMIAAVSPALRIAAAPADRTSGVHLLRIDGI